MKLHEKANQLKEWRLSYTQDVTVSKLHVSGQINNHYVFPQTALTGWYF
jgi:hypothetical protein